MKLQLISYDKKYDDQLIDFFYECVFHNRDEFEYTRPKSWLQRYNPYKLPIIKIAKYKNNIIGTLGILPTLSVVNGKVVKGGYFVDNCISPIHSDKYEKIMFELFKSAEKDAKSRKFKFIAGWDYLNNFEQHYDLYSLLGFDSRRGANWVVGGLEYKTKTPKKWLGNKKLYWRTAFLVLKLYNLYKRFSTPNEIKGVNLKLIQKEHLEKISFFLNNNHPTAKFHSYYTRDTLKDLWDSIGLRCLLAEKNNEILAVITFTISTWTGMMYGKPFDEEWEEFRTITPDEFAISKEWINTNLPVVMLRTLLDFDGKFNIFTGSSGFVSAIFDRGVKWEREAYKIAGFIEAKADFGVYLVKSLNEFSFNTECAWSIPARAIIAPCPQWIKY